MPHFETATSRDGTQIAHERTGSGPVLVFVTGAVCHRRFAPIRQDVKAFAEQFRVTTYDRRGRGDSGDTDAWSSEKEIEDLEAVIDAVGGRALLYGHSLARCSRCMRPVVFLARSSAPCSTTRPGWPTTRRRRRTRSCAQKSRGSSTAAAARLRSSGS